MARVEATISDVRGRQVSELADELGVTKSQLVDEAIGLYMTAALETKRGLRVALVEPDSQKPVREIVSPSLSQLEWAAHRERVVLSNAEFDALAKLVASPPAPSKQLRGLLNGSPKEKLVKVLAARKKT